MEMADTSMVEKNEMEAVVQTRTIIGCCLTSKKKMHLKMSSAKVVCCK